MFIMNDSKKLTYDCNKLCNDSTSEVVLSLESFKVRRWYSKFFSLSLGNRCGS